jgi:hypothetical protein
VLRGSLSECVSTGGVQNAHMGATGGRRASIYAVLCEASLLDITIRAAAESWDHLKPVKPLLGAFGGHLGGKIAYLRMEARQTACQVASRRPGIIACTGGLAITRL